MHEARVFLRHSKGARARPYARAAHPERAEWNRRAIEIFSDDSAQTATLRKAEALERLAFLDHLTQTAESPVHGDVVRTSWMEYREQGSVGLS